MEPNNESHEKIIHDIEKTTEKNILKLMSNEGKPLENYIATKIVENVIGEKKDEIKIDISLCDLLVKIMSKGADEFQQKTGRQMTYAEMREIYG